MSQNLKFAIFGCGLIGNRRAACLPAGSLRYACDVDLAKAAALAARYTGCQAIDAAERVWSDPAVNAVIVSAANLALAPLTLAAVRAGKHVLVEKPLATRMEDAIEIARQAEASSARLMVAQGYRFVDGAKRIRALISAGEIGDLRNVRVTFRKYLPDYLPPEHSIYSWRHSLIIDMGVHHFDLMRFITQREFTRAFAIEHETPDNAFAYPSNALCVLRLDGEIPAVWDAYWSSTQPETAWEGDWELVGSKARLFWKRTGDESREAAIWVHRPGEPPERLAFRESVVDRRHPVLEHFIKSVTEGFPPEPGVRDNLKTLRAALGCVQSLLTNSEVFLDSMLPWGARPPGSPDQQSAERAAV